MKGERPPIVLDTGLPQDRVLGLVPPVILELGWSLVVLALAVVLFYLYARQRLRRPESMLA